MKCEICGKIYKPKPIKEKGKITKNSAYIDGKRVCQDCFYKKKRNKSLNGVSIERWWNKWLKQ